MEARPIYAAISSNRCENNLSCRKNLLLYSRGKVLVLQQLDQQRGTECLHGHSSNINGQQFIHQSSNSEPYCHIISTAQDKSAIIWRVHESRLTWERLYQIQSPDDNCFLTRCSIQVDQGQFYSITTTIDGSICFWQDDQLLQTTKENYYCFDAKLYPITDSNDLPNWLLFLAASDNKIHVFQVCKSSLEYLFDITGHGDWIKCLDTLKLDDDQQAFLLASASQDNFIRVWHMKLVDEETQPSHIRTSVSEYLFELSSDCIRLTATLETVISCHEGIVHGLCWFKKQAKPILQLVSCSADKTLALSRSSIAEKNSESGDDDQLNKYNQCPASSEVWRETHRLGETGETNLPFLGVCLSDDESTIFANSLRGAIHSWKLQNDRWIAGETITGHHEPVTDLVWEKSGAYLLSSSLDKTIRLHSQCSLDNRWYELARPQVHGHEINCITSLSKCKFASGAEEKTIRTYEATQFFVKNFRALSKNGASLLDGFDLSDLPAHAQLPALGLSSKGSQCPYDLGQDPKDNNWYITSKLVEGLATVNHLETIPSEEILLQSTLWWEYNKLFGHSNELHAMDSTSSFLASASKANRADLANVVVWDTSKFRKVATIEHHSLTVTRLRFSPDERYLLSVSRDRTWCLSEKTGTLRDAYKKKLGSNKTTAVHERIIWDCCWTHDSRYFMTVSRDKKAVLWSIKQLTSPDTGGDYTSSERIKCLDSRNLSNSIQAVDSFHQHHLNNSYLFALGLEDGSIEVYVTKIIESTVNWQQVLRISNLHYLPIRRLIFKPQDETIILASAGDDCIVRLTELRMVNK